ncbi:MBL fold metallo-hydrolase [Dyadobacter tibetensis]|uniref:MBL fold metallo-hydrolase n=1 Tax=Dyadobacter tibetensis TaxID=1211851 RepID=UPI00046F449A|nr:MBL fold metallo-hydrolase [Dyadobacter tibetensis]
MITFTIFLAILGGTVFFSLRMESLGKAPKGDRLLRIKQSPHYKDGSFQNLTPTPVQSEDASLIKMLHKMLINPNPNVSPKADVPVVRTAFLIAPSPNPTITYFGHSSYMIQRNGINILVDPVFSKRISPVSFIGTKGFKGSLAYGLEDLPSIDFVVLTHDHYDHMDHHTIKAMIDSPTRFVVPLGVGAHLEYWGIAAERITELDWWETTSIIPDVNLTATPARHFSGRSLKRGQTLWVSYVFKTASETLFLGGDSGYEQHFKEIGRKFGPFDLAILECGQYNRWWPYIHMMPEQTVQASFDLGAKALWPVHWGKYALAMHDWNEPARRIAHKAHELNMPLATPMIGEQIILGKPWPNSEWWELG